MDRGLCSGQVSAVELRHSVHPAGDRCVALRALRGRFSSPGGVESAFSRRALGFRERPPSVGFRSPPLTTQAPCPREPAARPCPLLSSCGSPGCAPFPGKAASSPRKICWTVWHLQELSELRLPEHLLLHRPLLGQGHGFFPDTVLNPPMPAPDQTLSKGDVVTAGTLNLDPSDPGLDSS